MFLMTRMMSKAPQVLTTFLIFSLSAGVLGGILFYIDSAGPSVLDDLTSDLTYDMEVSLSNSFYRQNTTSLYSIESLLNSQEEITNIERLSIIESYEHQWEYYDDHRSVFLGVESTFFTNFPNAITTADSIPSLTDTTCFLEEQFFLEEEYQIGDDYLAEIVTYDDYYNEIIVNMTLEVVGTFTTDIFLEEYYYYSPYDIQQSERTALRMITTKNALNEGFEEIGFGQWDGISERYWISLDHEAILESDVTTVVDNLDSLRRQFEQEALPFAMVSSFGLMEAVYQYTSWSMGMTTIALAFSIPSIIMGVLLVYYNSNMISDELRRDVGTIKTRGASGRQAFSWILSSAVVTGLLGSFGAILMGILGAFISGTVKTFFVFDFTQLADLALIFQLDAVASVFIFSFGVGMVVAIPIGIRAYLMSATEAHGMLERDSLLSQENLGSPLTELIVLGISGYILFYMLQFVGFLGFSGYSIVSILIFLIPLMGAFVLSFARLLARGAAGYKSRILGSLRAPSLRVGTSVLSRTVLMQKKSEAMGVVFIAMVFTAAVFSSISATTGFNHTESVHKFYVGADIALTVDRNLTNVTTSLLQNLTEVEGVNQICPVYSFQGAVSYYTTDWNRRNFINETMTIYAVDPETWSDTAFWLPYFTQTYAPETALTLMAGNDFNILSSFKPIDHYEDNGFTQTPVYGDTLTLYLRGTSWVNVTDMTIVDVMANEGGSSGLMYTPRQSYLPGEPSISRFVVVDLDYVHRCRNTTRLTKFYVKTDPGANYTEVMRNLWNVASNSFENIESSQLQIEEALDTKAGQTVYGVYTLNVLFTVTYLSIGIIIVASVRIRGLRKQFAVLRALGTESRSIVNAVLIDASLGLLMAAAIGGTIGLTLAYFAINMPLVYFGAGTLTMWLRLPVILAVPSLLLGAILGCSFLFALLATYGVTKATQKKNIAEQIQYTE
ncbi:MAG: hypothetical protein P1Q69_16890, partial [Candidatus Thorarchaeota archaeon]|nr:hypothetical protein [Candidatus Thorarchaeota archaeon]